MTTTKNNTAAKTAKTETEKNTCTVILSLIHALNGTREKYDAVKIDWQENYKSHTFPAYVQNGMLLRREWFAGKTGKAVSLETARKLFKDDKQLAEKYAVSFRSIRSVLQMAKDEKKAEKDDIVKLAEKIAKKNRVKADKVKADKKTEQEKADKVKADNGELTEQFIASLSELNTEQLTTLAELIPVLKKAAK